MTLSLSKTSLTSKTRKPLLALALIAVSFFTSLSSFAQLITWSAAGNNQTFGPTVWPAASLNTNLTLTTPFTRGSAIATSGTAASPAYGGSGGWSSTGGTDANGFVFAFTPDAGTTVSLTNITAYIRRSNSGPSTLAVQYAIDNGAYATAGTVTSFATSGTTGSLHTVSLSSIAALQDVANGSTIKIRLLPQGSTTGNFYFMNQGVALSGVVESEPLAILLGNVAAVNNGAANRIDWNSITEEAGDVFEIEHSSNGADFSKLATIKAKGTPGHYSYTDATPFEGVNFYRLNLRNNDGSRAYSKIVTATVDKHNAFALTAYPNPVYNSVAVNVKGATTANAAITLTDATGKVIATQQVTTTDALVTFDASQLPAGIYVIRFEDGKYRQSVKVVKAK